MADFVTPLGAGPAPMAATPGTSETKRPGVGETFGNLLNETANNLSEADRLTRASAAGGPVDLHDVMIAMEKADISLRLLVQVRNKALDAYQEIMRMQV